MTGKNQEMYFLLLENILRRVKQISRLPSLWSERCPGEPTSAFSSFMFRMKETGCLKCTRRCYGQVNAPWSERCEDPGLFCKEAVTWPCFCSAHRSHGLYPSLFITTSPEVFPLWLETTLVHFRPCLLFFMRHNGFLLFPIMKFFTIFPSCLFCFFFHSLSLSASEMPVGKSRNQRNWA